MTPDIKADNFLPILQPPHWEGWRKVPCRRLVEVENVEVPLVALGWDEDEQLRYMNADPVADLVSIERQARRNLRRRHPDSLFQEQQVPLDDGVLRLLLRSDDEYTAADILLPPLMRHAHKLLDQELLVVGIPNRFSMIVAAADYAPVLALFVDEQYRMSHDEQMGPLSPFLFLLEDGKVVGTASPQADDSTSE
jgi:hypothetical protein